jgi:hypothetical protein
MCLASCSLLGELQSTVDGLAEPDPWYAKPDPKEQVICPSTTDMEVPYIAHVIGGTVGKK